MNIEEIQNTMKNNVKHVFNCNENEIYNISLIKGVMTNIAFTFNIKGHKYVYRHPGVGSEMLVNRGRESVMQEIASNSGIDPTLVAINVEEGWRIGKYIEHSNFNYKDEKHVAGAMKLLRAVHNEPPRVRWNIDFIKKARAIKDAIEPQNYGLYPEFNLIRERIYKLSKFVETDEIKKCYVHGDARSANILCSNDGMYLIDWEYSGYGDPGLDIGSYVCGGEHKLDEVDRIISLYCQNKQTKKQRRHFYAYIAIVGWFLMHWSMLKQSKGQLVGVEDARFYHFAKNYSILAIQLYGVNVKNRLLEQANEEAKQFSLKNESLNNSSIYFYEKEHNK